MLWEIAIGGKKLKIVCCWVYKDFAGCSKNLANTRKFQLSHMIPSVKINLSYKVGICEKIDSYCPYNIMRHPILRKISIRRQFLPSVNVCVTTLTSS